MHHKIESKFRAAYIEADKEFFEQKRNQYLFVTLFLMICHPFWIIYSDVCNSRLRQHCIICITVHRVSTKYWYYAGIWISMSLWSSSLMNSDMLQVEDVPEEIV